MRLVYNTNMDISKVASQMGKRSWEVRKSDAEVKRLAEMSKLGVEARRKKRESKAAQTV